MAMAAVRAVGERVAVGWVAATWVAVQAVATVAAEARAAASLGVAVTAGAGAPAAGLRGSLGETLEGAALVVETGVEAMVAMAAAQTAAV